MSSAENAAERLTFHGRHEANGIVIDVALIGASAARERVLAHWQPGARLLRLSPERWLLALTHPVSLEFERAPGLPVMVTPEGILTLSWHGQLTSIQIEELPEVDTGGWVDLSTLPVQLLQPVDRVAVVVVPLALDRPEPPDLRRRARIRRDPRAERMAAQLATAGRRSLAQRSGPGGTLGGGSRRGGQWFESLLRRTPVGSTVSRRQQRYLSSLVEQFEKRDYETALRGAIALGGAAGRLSMRLPTPRSGVLRPGRPSAGGRGLAVGPLDAQLRRLYVQAAEELTAQGRIEEAAFVHADLLGSVLDAVNLLERHQHEELAADLAQAHNLPPETVVRLWWRAGRRDQAVAYALAKGAFAGAVEALATVDPAGSLALRTEWVQACRAAADHSAAVRAAWPEASLRDGALGDLQAGMARGGPGAGELLALMVTHRPTEPALALTDALLLSSDVELAPAAARCAATLGEHQSTDPAANRRLATAALRSAVRDGTLSTLGGNDRARIERNLRHRADPLAAADLPRPLYRVPARSDLLVNAHEPDGVLVHDAVALPGGILVALGALGVRLLSTSGRVRARWGTATTGFVVADHGGLVLLLNQGEQMIDVHRLDLTTRQLQHWSTLRLRRVLPGYDGAVLMAQDDDGLVFLDTTSPGPRVLWRELDPQTTVIDLTRTPSSLCALVSGPQTVNGRPEIWRWSLPDLTLRSRQQIEIPDVAIGALAVDGALLTLHQGSLDELELRYLAPGATTPTAVRPAEAPHGLLAAGEELVTSTRAVDGAIVLDRFRRPKDQRTVVRLTFPGQSGVSSASHPMDLPAPRIRLHDERLVAYDHGGRVVVVDLSTGLLRASLVVRAGG
jgi:hypothetical protein